MDTRAVILSPSLRSRVNSAKNLLSCGLKSRFFGLRPQNDNRGFTLIELLVVLAIIALLLTIAVPRYFGSLDRSKEAVLKEDLYQLRSAIDKYYGDKASTPRRSMPSSRRNIFAACRPTRSPTAARPGWWSRQPISRKAACTT